MDLKLLPWPVYASCNQLLASALFDCNMVIFFKSFSMILSIVGRLMTYLKHLIVDIALAFLCSSLASSPRLHAPAGLSLYPAHTENLFEILLNPPEIRLYLPFSDWFGSKRTVSVGIQVNRKMVNTATIWFQVDLIRFRKDFSACGEWKWDCSYRPRNLRLSASWRPN